MGEFKCTCGADRPRHFDRNRQVYVKRELHDEFIDCLLRLGHREVRDPGFSQGKGTSYIVKNTGFESNRHFILWHLIYEEIKQYTNDVGYHLTRGPDIEFTSIKGRRIAVEVEATKKTYDQMKRKLEVLEKYDEWFIVVTKSQDLKYYRGYGPTYTRTQIRNLIAEYFKPEPQPEPKTKPQPHLKQETNPHTNSAYLYQPVVIPLDKSQAKPKGYIL